MTYHTHEIKGPTGVGCFSPSVATSTDGEIGWRVDPISKFSVLFFRFSIEWFYLAIQPPNSWFRDNGHFRMLVWPQIDLEHLRFWIRCCVNRPKIWVSDVLLAEEQLWILEPKIHPTLYQVWNIHDMQLSCERWAKWTKPAHVWKEQFKSLLPKRI